MQELLNFATSGPIIGYTIFFAFMILYWILVIIGALDLGSVDVDFDLDADIDIDVDADLDVDMDADGDIEASGGGSFFFAALKFFNFGRVPFMLIMTFLSISMWALAIYVHYSFGDGSIWFGLAVFIPILFVGLIITKVITTPFVGIFSNLMKGDAVETDFIGRTAKTILPHKSNNIGQVELLVDGRDMRLNTQIDKHWSHPISNNTEVIITNHNEDKSIFYIKPIEDLI